jgi:hypothetical protein
VGRQDDGGFDRIRFGQRQRRAPGRSAGQIDVNNNGELDIKIRVNGTQVVELALLGLQPPSGSYFQEA